MREELGGLSSSERMVIAQLRVAHSQFAAFVAAHGVRSSRIPGIEDFLPDQPELEREPLDFMGWASALLAV